jgi:hypothetical protein
MSANTGNQQGARASANTQGGQAAGAGVKHVTVSFELGSSRWSKQTLAPRIFLEIQRIVFKHSKSIPLPWLS